MTLKSLYLRLMALAIVFGLGLAPMSVAQAKSVAWLQYDVDIAVQTDGSLQVVERQVINFQGGPFTQGFAIIPLEGSTGITDVKVLESEQPLHVTTERSSDSLTVDWDFPSTSNTTRTFELSYRVQGAVRQYASGDKIRFQVISPEFDFPIQSSTITVQLPAGAPVIDDPDSIGAPLEWQTGLDNRTVTFKSTRAINSGEGVGIQLIFKHGAMTTPPPAWQAEFDKNEAFDTNTKPLIDLGLWAVALALLVAVPGMLYGLWFLFGRDPNPRLTPDYVSTLPSDLPPGLAGVLIDERVDLRDIVSTLVDFARRGFVTFEESQVAGAFGSSAVNITVRKAKAPEGLRRYESMLYEAVFGATNSFSLQTMPMSFFSRQSAIESAMYDEVVSLGFLNAHPEKVRSGYRTAGLLFLGATLVFGCLVTGAFGSLTGSVICPLIPLMLFGLGLIVLSGSMPARTRKGAEETAKWRAFQKYLGNIQQYQDIAGAVDQFEKYLPYAVAFGLERRWVNAFAKAPATVVVPAPIWYRPWRPMMVGVPGLGAGAGGVAPSVSVPNLNTMGQGMANKLNSIGDNFVGALNTAGRALSSPPGSSSTYTYRGGGSRGFSGGRSTFRGGGGFRGGGFSGGGGRGFR